MGLGAQVGLADPTVTDLLEFVQGVGPFLLPVVQVPTGGQIGGVGAVELLKNLAQGGGCQMGVEGRAVVTGRIDLGLAYSRHHRAPCLLIAHEGGGPDQMGGREVGHTGLPPAEGLVQEEPTTLAAGGFGIELWQARLALMQATVEVDHPQPTGVASGEGGDHGREQVVRQRRSVVSDVDDRLGLHRG